MHAFHQYTKRSIERPKTQSVFSSLLKTTSELVRGRKSNVKTFFQFLLDWEMYRQCQEYNAKDILRSHSYNTCNNNDMLHHTALIKHGRVTKKRCSVTKSYVPSDRLSSEPTHTQHTTHLARGLDVRKTTLRTLPPLFSSNRTYCVKFRQHTDWSLGPPNEVHVQSCSCPVNNTSFSRAGDGRSQLLLLSVESSTSGQGHLCTGKWCGGRRV